MRYKTIYKYPVEFKLDGDLIEIPVLSSFRHFGAQDNQLYTWWEVQPTFPLDKKRLYVIGTGQPIPDDATWLATTQVGPYVWHLYRGLK